ESGQVTQAGLANDVVYSIAGGPNDLWVGRQSGALTHLRPNGTAWTSETLTSANGLAAGPVYAVHWAKDGSVWAGTLNGGVSRIRAGRITTYTANDGLPSNSISAIHEGAGGTIWVATANGLAGFSQEKWRSYASEDGMPPGRINCLFEDASG